MNLMSPICEPVNKVPAQRVPPIRLPADLLKTWNPADQFRQSLRHGACLLKPARLGSHATPTSHFFINDRKPDFFQPVSPVPPGQFKSPLTTPLPPVQFPLTVIDRKRVGMGRVGQCDRASFSSVNRSTDEPLAEVKTVRIFLEPDPEFAETIPSPSADCIWGQPIVIENVKLDRYDLEEEAPFTTRPAGR